MSDPSTEAVPAARRDLAVPADLAPYVLSIRVHESFGGPVDVQPHTVLPGPFPVLGCRWSGALHTLDAGGERRMARSGFTGLLDAPSTYRPDAGTRTVLVYLRPEGASALFGGGMDKVAGRETGLDALLPPWLVRDLEERTAEAETEAAAADAVHALLRDAVAGRPPIPAAVRAAVSGILASRGSARIEGLADAAAVSRRQLERLFRAHVGVSPKRLASLARFAWAAARLREGGSWSRLALDAGYADQAHFIRSFAALAGAPPARFLAGRPADAPSHFFNTGT